MQTKFLLASLLVVALSCADKKSVTTSNSKPDYFNLRPQVEKVAGYTHAVRIGDDIKISGAVSMDTIGNTLGKGDILMQIKNCYADIAKILKHYDGDFTNVTVENIYVTDMQQFFQHANYRNEIYKNQFPTGTWLEVKGLASPEYMVEIEVEAHIENHK
jgi:2-iminobutanoate/2-iminopropanoate deaminase